MIKQKDLGEQMRKQCGREGEKRGLLSHFTLRGSQHVTRIRCTARHDWQWWALWAWDPAFSTPPNSPGQASLSLWQDVETSCQLKCDSLCLTLTHSPTHSFTCSFPLTPYLLTRVFSLTYFFLLIISASFPSLFISHSCLSSYSFALWQLLVVKSF